MRAKTKQAKKTNKVNNELTNRIKQLEAQLEKVERELQPPIETKCCNICKATLPLPDFRLLKNLKHTKGCLKCLEKRREKIRQKEKLSEPPLPPTPPTPEDTEGTEGTDSDSSQGGPTVELFQLTEMINTYCQNNNTTVLNVARFNYPSCVGWIMSHFNRVRITRNHLAHPITPFEFETPQELIETLMQFKFL
jgi:hypothetical protein